MLLIPR